MRSSPSPEAARALLETDLREAFFGSLLELDPREGTARALTRLALDGPVVLLAAGKGARSMATGARDVLGACVERQVVVVPSGSATGNDDLVGTITGEHPVPGQGSVQAGEALLDAARAAGEGTIVFLVSGGASSLACAPAAGVTLERKRAVTEALLASGASIVSTNLVRRHLSRLKGGGILRAAPRARVITLALSDVLGGSLADVGSGPSLPDRTSEEAAKETLWRYLPAFAATPLSPGFVPDSRQERMLLAVSVGEPEVAAHTLAARVRSAGYRVKMLPSSTASVSHLAAEYADMARALARGEALVRVAEPCVRITIPSPGSGGRCCHLAAALARELPDDVVFLAGATDGTDGTSETAGAVVGRDLVERAGRGNLQRAIERFDTGPLHLRAKTAIPAGATGTNLCDLHVLVRAR